MRRPVFSAPELRTPATDLYVAYCDWLSAVDPVERLTKQRQFMGGRVAKYRFLARLGLRWARQDALAAFGFFVEPLLERFGVRRRKGRNDEPRHQVRQRKILGEGNLEGLIKGHSDLSRGGIDGPIGGGVAGAGNRPFADWLEDLQ